MQHLELKFNKYLELIKSKQDVNGFIETDKCDSLLFSGLVGCVPGVKVILETARSGGGRWFRRPVHYYSECYSCGESKSTISRDMLLGVAWYAYFNKRLDISEGVINYALSHLCVMGKGPLSRTFMTPSLLATFAWVSYKLGGPSRPWLRWIPEDFNAKLSGYQAHLQALHVMLRQLVTGKTTLRQEVTLNRLRREHPKNPLMWVNARDDASNIWLYALLSDDTVWPNGELPNSWMHRKDSWVVQRDDGPDWRPSTEDNKVHSGGDYLFVYWLSKVFDNASL
jgi:hypothetical protein